MLSTELNSLANNGYCSAGSAIGADATGGPMFADFELVLGSLNPTATVIAELYALRSADGTNYEDAPSSTNPGTLMYLGTFVGATGSAAKRLVLADVQLPPGLWKPVLKNTSGVTLAASGNTVKQRSFNLLST